MPAAPSRAPCANHPDRPGRALCMTCKKVVCQECATQWEGINYCVLCLAGQRQAVRTKTTSLGYLPVLGAIAFLLWASARLMVWVNVVAASFS
ncbi:MAG: B-box zinc finger protein [Planctomycetes bacterium]|nr:B-box zinc finger protein [Planctomycetota bacterium]